MKEINRILVNKNHRCNDPSSKDYEFLEDYINRMKEENGLLITHFFPYVISSDYSCFEVIDEGKAFQFVMLNSEFIQKPTELFHLE